MIEGLRVLPYWQHATADPLHPYRDCTTCMQRNTATERQRMGCGYEPPTGAKPWFPIGDDGWADTCPGYTTRLPEVIETAENYPHWKERTLTDWLEGPPTRDTLHGLAVLGNAIGAYERWRMEQDRLKRGTS